MTGRLLAFAVVSLALIAIPGPNMVYIVTRTAAQGLRAGIASALGVEAGTLLHIAAAGVGVAALIAASPVAFAVVKYASVAYLVYLGWRALRQRPRAAADDGPDAPLWRLFADGALVNALNPKVVLFFLAFLPQFVRSQSWRSWGGTFWFWIHPHIRASGPRIFDGVGPVRLHLAAATTYRSGVVWLRYRPAT